MYVQYVKLADSKARYPLLMWHGGGLSGVTWETKPDGKPGWQQSNGIGVSWQKGLPYSNE
jgi:hypothetical protein